MSYNVELAARVRGAVCRRRGVSEKEMFGGLAFLLKGRMFCGIIGRDLMVRVGPDRYESALAEPGVRPMDFTGRPMRGYVFVGAPGLRNDKAIERWVRLGALFASGLPAKEPGKRLPKLARRRPPRSGE